MLFISNLLAGEDTVFVARHWFPGPVHNVFAAENQVFVKAGRSLFKWENQKWEQQSGVFDKFFVFYGSNGFYEVDYVLDAKLFDPEQMRHLIPQANLVNSTAVLRGERLFVSVGGALYEYKISNDFVRTFPELSIRHIYKSPRINVISTYGGIFVNVGRGYIKTDTPYFSNGKFWPTSKGSFLFNDEVYKYLPPYTFEKVEYDRAASLGKVRKGVMYRDSMIVQLTTSICYFDTSTGFTPLHTGYEYRDIENYGSSLLFVTETGELISYFNGRAKVENNIRSRIRDLYIGHDGIFLSSDKGVFFLKAPGAAPVLFADIPKAAGVVEDNTLNAWISSDLGLFVVPKGTDKILPYIENVEFNWGALEFVEDTVFAGSIQGLYAVDYFKATKIFIPQAINRIERLDAKDRNKNIRWIAGGVAILSLFVWLWRRRKTVKLVLLPQATSTNKDTLSLDQMEKDIVEHNLISVEALANFYETNPVQLNRMFKNFDTTPGKFLKKVKIDLAVRMLANGSSMADVVAKTGYSAQFLKNELKAFRKK